MRRRLTSLAVVIGLLAPIPSLAQSGPSNCSVSSQNLYVRDVLFDLYYWNRFLPAVNPTSYGSPESYLEAVRYRPLDTYFSYITSAAASEAFYSDSQYIGYGFGQQTTTAEMRVLQVYPDSPAQEAGLARGDRIVEINGRSVSSMIANGTVGSAFGASEIGVVSSIVFESRSGGRRDATMVKRLVTIPTVSLTRVYDLDGRKVGYLFFRNFVRPSMAALDEAFAALKEAGVTELVLDLRYNGGGLVDVAVHLGSLIGGALTRSQPFATYKHNDRNARYNETIRFEDISEPPLALSRLVAITTRSSASASELVINSLRPFMAVDIIGDATYGKPVGQYQVPFCQKILAPVSFSLRNANDEGDYFDGLPPTCVAGDDIEHELGDAAEASLAEAFHFIRHGACSTAATAAARALRADDLRFRATGWQSLVNAY
jgi:C-terminal peptidase prc